jgi:phosphoserine phosphatase
MSAVTESEIYARWPQPLDEAAFFDLDKTVIAKDAMVAFGGPLRKHGLMKRRSLAQVVLAEVIYLILGSNDRRLDRIRAAILRLTKGWSRAEVVAIVDDALESVVEPIIYDEAMDLIDDHHSAGRKVVIVSA